MNRTNQINIKKPVIIALVGKGGVGKTSLSALTVRLLSKSYPDKKILAIDADPAVGLSVALGLTVTSTVDDIRHAFVRSAEEGETRAAIELLGEARYQLVDAMVEEGNISFLAIGRPEAAGCYCTVNTYLKNIISRLADHFDYVVIDGEAGIEQVNRRVMEQVTHLLLVSDASRKGIQVAATIRDVARDLVMYERCGLILNRIPAELAGSVAGLELGDLDLLACIPDDRTMTISDMLGSSVFTLPEETPVYQGLQQALERFGMLK